MNNWFIKLNVCRNPKYRILLFSCAGGNINEFKKWSNYIPDTIELYGLQLPGRGQRINEPNISRINVLLKNIVLNLNNLIELPFAFVGHSFGGIIAFELTKLLHSIRKNLPKHLYIAAREAPGNEIITATYNSDNKNIIKYINKMAGISSEILDNKELMNILIPALKSDLKIDQEYYQNFYKKKVINCPITVLLGSKDYIKKKHIIDWQKETTSNFNIRFYPGNHFFIFKQIKEISNEIISNFN